MRSKSVQRPCMQPARSALFRSSYPYRPRSLTALSISLLLAMGYAQAAAPADADESADAASQRRARNDDARTLDAVSVTASSMATEDAVGSKRNAVVSVDSLDKESIQVHSQEDSIAQKLVTAPGISLMRDEDQPRYITARGVQANYNMTTLDGITMASVGDEGGGERKINLQLIPNDIADRIDVYKSFSAEQNPDSIGAAISLVSGSAFDHPRNSLHVDASVNYHDLGNDSGANTLPQTESRWGNGINGKYSTTFGADEQFGITLSARRQEFQTSQNKLFQSSTAFYDTAGTRISGPTSPGWNGLHAPHNVAYYADNRWIKSDGGSAKFEWWPDNGALRASLMAYQYGMEEHRTENGYELLSVNNDTARISNQTATSGTVGLDSINIIFQNKIWKRESTGVIGSLEWTGDRQWMALRAGVTGEEVNVATDSIRLTARPAGATMDYATHARGEIFNIASVSDPAMFFSQPYTLNSASQQDLHATADVTNLRYDYAFNTGADARGFGVAAGVEHRELDVRNDSNTINTTSGQDFSGYLYDPGWDYPRAPYRFPFFDYDQFADDGAWGALPVNVASSLNASQTSDFRYVEDVNDAYVSLHYATDRLLAVLGARYDDVSFDAYMPTVESGAVTGRTTNDGGYSKLLPSLNLTFRATDDVNLRFSASRTLGRPVPSNIAQAESASCASDGSECTVTRGNPDLQPLQSTNLDLSVEKYFDDNRGYVSLALFDKQIKDNIVGIATEQIEPNGSLTTISTPTNVDDSKVRGVELSLVQRDFTVLGQRFDVLFNAALMDGETTYTSTNASRTVNQLIGQPKKIANLGISWHLPFLDSTLTITENYTGKHIFTMGANEWGDRGFRSRYVTDVAFNVRFTDNWSASLSAANLFDEDQYQTLGDSYQYMRNLNNYAATYALHVRYDMN